MIISHKHKFISLDPPKTGTNYRQNILWSYGDYIRELQHANLNEVKNFFQGSNLEDYFVFTFVRNPWRRYLSWFNFLYRNSPEDKVSPQEFYSFMRSHLSLDPQESNLRITLPQSYWFEHQNEINVNFIGCLENLKEDMEFVLRKIQINSPMRNKLENKSNYKLNFHDAYNQELIDLVAKKESKVIKLKGYTV